jgi:NAD(P)-dependent dehydrogenase (short-subunit alcohol dehydrogenase family)
VVNVSSRVHSMGSIDFDDLQSARKYRMFASYGLSKLACLMATFDLAERWQPLGVTVNCLHPGVIDTNLGGMPGFIKKLLPKADKGARTSLYLATAPEVTDTTGRYFSACKEAKVSPKALDRDVRRRLWAETERMTGLA